MSPRHFLLAVPLLAGCSGMPTLPSIAPYKIDVQQGNVVTQEMVSKLKPGMTRSQVRFILGTPLVVDPFRTDRWDYVYSYEKGGKVQEHRRIAVIFEGDKLVRVEGDVVPAPRDAAAAQPKPAASAAPKQSIVAPAPVKPAPEPAPPQAGGATLVTGTGEPVQAGGAAVETAGAPPEKKEGKPKPEKPAEGRGVFGRMLERLGF